MTDETAVGLREAKARLSEVIARVRRGRTILLTLRGRGVARLVPVRDHERPFAERLADLEEAGLIEAEPTGATPRGLPPPLPVVPGGLAQRYLAEDRGV